MCLGAYLIKYFGKDIELGITYYLDSKQLRHPIRELPEHYEEVIEEKDEEEVLPVD